MPPARLGIRGKLLGFYGATLAVVLGLEVLVQGAAVAAGAEFEARLARYHAVQAMRSALADYRALADRYMREGRKEQLESLAAAGAALPPMSEALTPLSADSLEALFEARAARRAVEAYLPLAAEAFRSRGSSEPDSYRRFLEADKVALWADTYLGKLLSEAMSVGNARYREIAARSGFYRRLALAGIAGAGLLSLAFAWIFALSIASPIRRLAKAAARMAEGDLAVEPVPARTGDEVEILARSFNSMAENIRALVEGLKEKAELERLLHEEQLEIAEMGRALREAQYLNLQDRIRPHFLFNALNSIARCALLEGAEDSERLARGLAALMRYALAEGGTFVGLGEELAALREYLSLQAIRFGTRLRWEIRSDAEVDSIRVPRFILQPLVENAVRHGVEPLERGGAVRVSARVRGERVRLLVVDSGAGMGTDTLHAIRAAASGEPGPAPARAGEGAGIGFANIAARLDNRYGGEARLSVASRRGRGTVVRISLPARAAAGSPA